MIGRSPSAADRFHGHLDACRQCRENPMRLCAAGATLLSAAATDLAADVHALERQFTRDQEPLRDARSVTP